jgi:succinate dehydrogenase / fumarate reductase cytochrome b subunit
VFGAFLVEHLAATALGWKPGLFGRYMQFVHAVVAEAPWLKTLILVPLAVAAVFGGYLLVTAGVRYNVKKCNRGGKLRYWLQRASAVVLFLFLGFHLLSLQNFHLPVDSLGPSKASGSAARGEDPARAVFAASVQGFQASWPKDGPLYPLRVVAMLAVLVGTWAAVYHASNGLWSAAIAWGLLETPASQQRWEWVCLTIGSLLAILGTLGWLAFSSTGGG